MCEKHFIWNPATYTCKNGKYLANIIDDSVITFDEIMEETQTIPANFNQRKATCKTKSFIFYSSFY